MKKSIFAIVAIVAAMVITSCGNGATSQTETADSTAVQVDTTAVSADTTAVDTTAVVK